MTSSRKRISVFSWFLVLLSTLLIVNPVLAATNTVVTPVHPDSWHPENVRTDATVGITTAQPRGDAPNNLGSLEFATNTVTNGQDKADYVKTWGIVAGRTLGNLSALSYEFYRASTSTTGQHFVPAFRLAYATTDSPPKTGYLIWENVYNGGNVNNAVPTNQWISNDIFSGNFWMRAFGSPSVTIEQFNVTLAQWKNGVSFPNSHVLGADTNITGIEIGVGSGWGASFRGFVDNVAISFGSDSLSANFEPDTCNICYADAVNGLDTNDGATIATAKKTIQAAIDAVLPNGQVRVLPGTYNEQAVGRTVATIVGATYQFGLFFDDSKSGVTLQGVDAGDNPITAFSAAQATINTKATNDFGPSGIFVQGDNVTIAGVRIGTNTPDQNKTIEVIGDNFTLKHADIADPGGSVYISDFRFDGFTSHVKAYRLEGNNFQAGVSLDLASGAGFTGPVSGRVITGNTFTNGDDWASISFNGTVNTVPWYKYPVGGAVITGNTFENTFTGNTNTASHIRARGTYDNSQFDWDSYWHDNTFNKAVVTLVGAPAAFDVRTYVYSKSGYDFTNVRRIGPLIQPEIDHVVNGDTVLVNQGTYAENPTINKSLTLLSEDGRDLTTIALQAGPAYLDGITVDAPTVTIDGFTVVGFDGTPAILASSNIVVTTNAKNVIIQNNRLQVGQIDEPTSTGDDGMGVITYYNTDNPPVIDSVTLLNNEFVPVNPATGGARAFYINPGVNHFTFKQNQITGNFFYSAATQAKDGLVQDNTLQGNGSSAGFSTWGYPTPSVWGHTIFRNNTVSAVATAISLKDAESVIVEKNILSGNGRAVKLSLSGLTVGPINSGTVHVNRNNLANSSQAGIDNTITGALVDGQCNWWGDVTGPDGTGPGNGSTVSADVDFDPWLGSSNLAGPCATPSVQFETAAASVGEDVGNAAVVVKLSEASGQIVTINYVMSNGTATAGTDYTAQNGTLTFNPGVISQSINVPINDDSLDEDDETLNVTLSTPHYATLGAQSVHNLTIIDNDLPPVVQFSSPNVGVNENAGAAVIAVTLNTPSSHEVRVNYTTSDGTALANSDYTPISGQLIIPAGQMSTSFVVPIVNDTAVEPAETINLQLATPTNATLGTANAVLTVIDDDSGPLVNFSNAGYTVNEAAGTAIITVTLSTPALNSVTVGYTTSNGSANSGSDYTATSGTLTFAPGVTSQTFSIPLSDDSVAENDETVALSLSAPSGATLGAPANAILTIVDNDRQPTVQFSNATYNVNENGNVATITVNLSQVATIATTVNYATSNGTATAGSDYTATVGTLTFDPGQISQTFTVPIINDSTDESAEFINLTLSNANNATLGAQATASLTIIDDEGEPIVEGQSANLLVAENVSGGLATVTVTLSAAATQTVSVSYATSDVTALAGNDYVATSGTLTFNPGQMSRTFTVPILDDNMDEPNETVLIRYSTPANANLGAIRDVILTIVDNDLPPTVEFSRATYSTAENAGATLITVTLSAPSGFTVRAPYLISDGSATAGSDYSVANGSVTFAPGQTSKSFAIVILSDLLAESNETINLALSAPSNATLGVQQNATLTIVDAAPSFTVNESIYLPFISRMRQ